MRNENQKAKVKNQKSKTGPFVKRGTAPAAERLGQPLIADFCALPFDF
jgi:hypothetical protein